LQRGSSLPLFRLAPCQLLTPVTTAQLHLAFAFTAARSPPYTAIEAILRLHFSFYPRAHTLAACGFLASALLFPVNVQQAPQEPSEKPNTKSSTPAEPQNPAQFELLETRYRFEANGDSRKEVHALVHINSELGVRQFARLNFDYNRSFQSVDIPLVHVTHPSGGTADILPSAITDNPNPAVINAPAYQDVRVKSVRILGLAPGDTLEYRVLTTTTNHPLAPNFWLDHSFDRTGVVSEEHFQVVMPSSILASSALIAVKNENVRQQMESRLYYEPPCGFCSPPDIGSEIDLALIDPSILRKLTQKQKKQSTRLAKPAEIPPAPPPDEPLPSAEYGKVLLLVKPSASGPSIEKSSEGSSAQTSYTWKHTAISDQGVHDKESPLFESIPDIEIGKTSTWNSLSAQLFLALSIPEQLPEEVIALAQQLTTQAATPRAKEEGIYDFVSQKIRTIDLPLGATGFKPRPLGEILSSGYATQEDKFFLFEAIMEATHLHAGAALVGPSKKIAALMASPSGFSHLVIWAEGDTWLDPSLEVAPFGALPASYRGSTVLYLGLDTGYLVDLPAGPSIGETPKDLPFTSSQKVNVDASLDPDGKLTAKVHYSLRGDNELLLRVAFHQSPKEKWKDLAQLLSLSDGFRGQVSSVNASDPYATRAPFTVDYEITQPKFVDWSKKPIRIHALLPQLGLPDPPAKPAPGSATAPIELGTPLKVETHMTLHLPPGTTIATPTGTSVQRDYAAFASLYSAKGLTVTASRHINFLLRQVPAERAADYNAFLRAVLTDQAQDFTLDRESPPAPAAKL
jgi:uncharacterized protein DUF3857